MELFILDAIQNLRCPFLDFLAKLLSVLGDNGLIFIVSAIALLIPGKTRKYGICIAAALSLSFITGNLILKNAVARIRPYDVNNFSIIIPHLSDFSFPSGHSTAAFAFATAVFMLNKRAGIFCYIYAVLTAFSRLYLYVHYPSDVIFGAILGILCGIMANKIYFKLKERKKG